MRAPIQPHVRADHTAGGADRARAKIDHDQSVGEVVNADRRLMVAIAIGAIDMKIAHAVDKLPSLLIFIVKPQKL